MLEVTCIVPVKNGERYLGAALRSIVSQTRPPVEILVVDNGSTDGTAALADSFGPPVRVVREPDQGPGPGRKRGLQESRSELVAFLDGDDLFHRQKLERQLSRFEARPELDVSLCTAENFWEAGLEDERARYERLGRTRATHSFGTMLARRDVFDRVSIPNAGLLTGEAVEWFFRLADADLVVEVLPEILMSRRMHPGSLSHRITAPDAYLEIVRQRIARWRDSEAGAEAS